MKKFENSLQYLKETYPKVQNIAPKKSITRFNGEIVDIYVKEMYNKTWCDITNEIELMFDLRMYESPKVLNKFLGFTRTFKNI